MASTVCVTYIHHSEMTTVDISGLDKVDVLHALWNNQKAASFFAMSGMTPPPFDRATAATAVKSYIDYFQGRAIKGNLDGDTFDSFCYDRDCGSTKAESVIATMKGEGTRMKGRTECEINKPE